LVDHYGLLSKENKASWKNLRDNSKAEPTREEKIGSFKETKELEKKLKSLQDIKDENSQREVVITYINMSNIKAIAQIRQINQELEILDYKDKLVKDKSTKEEYEKKMQEPFPKLKAWHIPKH